MSDFQPINFERLPGGKNDLLLMRLCQILDMGLTLPISTMEEVAEEISRRHNFERTQTIKEERENSPEVLGAAIAKRRIIALIQFARAIQEETLSSLSSFEEADRARSLSAMYFMEPFTPKTENNDRKM